MIEKGKLDIWLLVQSGDRDAFDILYHRCVNSLYNYGCTLCPDVQLVEDAIQDMFINLWIKRSTISINTSIKGYLFISLRRKIISQIEKQQKSLLNVERADLSYYDMAPKSKVDSRIDHIKKEISKLSKREREAIVLKYQEGLSYSDISNIMNLKSSAIYKLVSRGIKKIKSNINVGMTMSL